MRWLIRITVFFMVLTVIIFNIQLAIGKQKEYPLGAKEAYTLTLLAKETSKEEILQDLHKLSQEHQAQLVRPLMNPETGRNDLAWFGSSLPQNQQIDTGQGTIYWLSDTAPGQVLPAGQLGEAPPLAEPTTYSPALPLPWRRLYWPGVSRKEYRFSRKSFQLSPTFLWRFS